ncbi:MAG: CoA transferase, partial [Chloroflexota bacterium]
PEGPDIFARFVKWADVLIDNYPLGHLESYRFGWNQLSRLNPALIYTCITPYGRTGPRSDVKGDELTTIHAAGLGNLMPTRSVDVDRAPVKMGGRPVGYHGAITAALATTAALLTRMQTGQGTAIDISLQEVILAMVQPNVAGNRYHDTSWSRVPDRPPAMGRMKTEDGFVILGAIEDHHFKALAELMGNPEWLSAPEWYWMPYRVHHLPDVAPLMDEWMSQQKTDTIYHEAARRGIAIGPVNSAKGVVNSRQYAARDYFVEVDHPEAGKHRYAGWPYQMSATPPRVRRPPPQLGEHNREVYCGALGYSVDAFQRLERADAI